MAYKAKYKMGMEQAPLKGYEVSKIINGIDKETRKQETWRMITSCLLIVFVIIVIIILGGQ